MEDSICKNFAKRLKEIREKQGLSKGQLSSLADCDISYIGKIERSEKYPNLKDKYKALSMDYTMTETARISPSTVSEFTRIFTDAGIHVIRT